MTEAINTFLEKHLQLRVNRVIKRKSLPKNEEGGRNNLIVEFVGAQGVGKSTLFRHYLKHHKRFDRALISTSEIGLYTKSALIEKADTRYFKMLYDRLLLARINDLQGIRPSESLLRYFMIIDYISILQNDIIINNFLSDKIAVFDRHIFKVFTRAPEFLPGDDPDTIEFMMNRVFIHCRLKPEILLQRIKKRTNETGKTKLAHRNRSDNEVLHIAMEQAVQIENQLKKLKMFGANLLEINGEDDFETNTKIIDDFLEQCMKEQMHRTVI